MPAATADAAPMAASADPAVGEGASPVSMMSSTLSPSPDQTLGASLSSSPPPPSGAGAAGRGASTSSTGGGAAASTDRGAALPPWKSRSCRLCWSYRFDAQRTRTGTATRAMMIPTMPPVPTPPPPESSPPSGSSARLPTSRGAGAYGIPSPGFPRPAMAVSGCAALMRRYSSPEAMRVRSSSEIPSQSLTASSGSRGLGPSCLICTENSTQKASAGA
mmetsp:Transcript_1953/g.4718  ORF Transcript_1953/g.4718 Transcript_1953/m.4718 type:complete len:218 (-) Transcript_1953:509-1162(-)